MEESRFWKTFEFLFEKLPKRKPGEKKTERIEEIKRFIGGKPEKKEKAKSVALEELRFAAMKFKDEKKKRPGKKVKAAKGKKGKPGGRAARGKKFSGKKISGKRVHAKKAGAAEESEEEAVAKKGEREKFVGAKWVVKGVGSERAKEVEEQASYIDEQVSDINDLMKSMEIDYFKHLISQQEFRDRVIELRQKKHLLELKKKRLLEKGYVERAETQAMEEEKPDIRRIIEEKASGRINEKRLIQLENKIEELLRKYNIPKKEIAEDILGIDKDKIISDLDKLINLIELEHGTKKLESQTIKPEKIETAVPKEFEKRREEVKAIATEITRHRIITELDKILEIVKQKGKTTDLEIAKTLNASKKQVAEWVAVLEENKLVKLNYPPFGGLVVMDVNYVRPKKERVKKNAKGA